MKTNIISGITLIAAAISLAACTTRPVTVDTPGAGETTVQVPVPATPDIKLTTQVREGLSNALGEDSSGIDVRVEEGAVYLTGSVATRKLHDQAVSVARGTANVKSVVHTGLIVK